MKITEDNIKKIVRNILKEIADPDNRLPIDIERYNRRAANGTTDNDITRNYYDKETPRTIVEKFKLPDSVGNYTIDYAIGSNYPGISIKFYTENLGTFVGDFFDDTALFGPVEQRNLKQMKRLFSAFKKGGYEPKINGKFIQIFNWRKFLNDKRNKKNEV